jgi:thioredoxin-like negative regulator of GroEL
MVTFYDPTCYKSEVYLKEWEASIAQGTCMSSDQYAFVDCTVDKALCTQYGITSFPTVVPFINGKMIKREYNGKGNCTLVKKHFKSAIVI